MDPANTPDNTADSTAADTEADESSATPESGERLYSRAEVDSIVANVRRSLAAKEKKSKPSNDSDAPSQQSQNVTKRELMAELENLRRGRDFDRALGGLPLKDSQRDALETLFRAESPEDVREWAERKIADLGWAKPQTQSIPEQQKTPAAKVDFGAPSPKAKWDQVINPNEWTADDIERIYAEKGVAAGRKFITERAERYLKNARVVPNKR